MSTHETTQPSTDKRRGLPVWWVTIAAFAIVIAYADGLIVTSLQGAVGAIERRQPLFERWLRDSTLMLPLFFLAVLAAMLLARRWVGHGHRGLVKLGTTALLIVVLTSGVAVAEMSVNAAYDYHLQTQHLVLVHQSMNMSTPIAAGQPGSVTQAGTASRDALRSSERDTLNVHLKAIRLGSLALLTSNLVLVLWVLALRSDRLWRRPESAPMVTTTAVPQELSLA
jgi:hypothetical protein